MQEKAAALQAIASMIERSEKAQVKFAKGTSQHTLQSNRIKALYIASSLINNESEQFTKEEMQKAAAPIESLISKSEKAQQKVAEGTWQHTMLENNIKALRIVLPLLKNKLDA